MIHPYARAAIVLVATYIAIFASQTELVLLFWVGWWIVAVRSRFAVVALGFHLTALLPIWIGLVLIGASETPGILNFTFDEVLPDAIRRTAALAVVGMALQWLAIPIIRSNSVAITLRSFRVPKPTTAVVLASLSAVEDLGRFIRIELDALNARGLGRGNSFWWFRELPSILVAVLTHGFRAGLAREETWRHRGIDPGFAEHIEEPNWDTTLSALVTLLAVIFISTLLYSELRVQ